MTDSTRQHTAHRTPQRALCAITLGIASSAPLTAAALPFDGDTEGFFETYEPTAVESTAPGTLVRYQRFADADGAVPDPDLYRVLYWSTVEKVVPAAEADPAFCTQHTFQVPTPVDSCCEHRGEADENLPSATDCGDDGGYAVTETRCEFPVLTSGLVRIPSDATGLPKVGLPSVLFTHGTLGMLPKCGPSRDLGPFWPSWMEDPQTKTVAADYLGLGYDSGLRSVDAGVRNPHPWYGGLFYMRPFDESTHAYGDVYSSGTTSVDAIRAGNALEAALWDDAAMGGGADANPDFAVMGSSQGGAAALMVGHLASQQTGYAPELNLVGIAAGAPGSRLNDPGTMDIELTQGILAAGMVGASMVDPAIRPNELMHAVGQANYERTSEAICSGTYELEAYVWWINTFYTYPFEPRLCDLMKLPAWRAFAARRQVTVDAPILLGQVDNDTLVPEQRSRDYFDDLRAKGMDVTYCVYEGEAPGPFDLLGGHVHTKKRLCEGSALSCLGSDGRPLPQSPSQDMSSAVQFFASGLFDDAAAAEAYVDRHAQDCE